jgi:nicotinamidase-related amidase
VQADVPDPTDASTQINTRLIQTLENADLIVIAGEARTHCLAHTVRDIANNFGDDSFVSKLVLLTDASSDIPGFEAHAQSFMSEMVARGMQLSTTTEFLA